MGALLRHADQASTQRYSQLGTDPPKIVANRIGGEILAAMNGTLPADVVGLVRRAQLDKSCLTFTSRKEYGRYTLVCDDGYYLIENPHRNLIISSLTVRMTCLEMGVVNKKGETSNGKESCPW